jgi:hypothetical protein
MLHAHSFDQREAGHGRTVNKSKTLRLKIETYSLRLEYTFCRWKDARHALIRHCI